ncbi:FlgD immunoglobulin-like domain containing protein [Fibrobacter sp.]|uniref:FlgD immunoglobulin-like domain containing protein n=1 Tax=Fibrobacter sp. TaxID=35828 RepID=UPI0025C3AD3A|nr:FlgD immunoglobulin-like domain containing protein [Fibrobacter sp.]MBR3071100.1 hypothetical protein [Fibrobacter sp.]
MNKIYPLVLIAASMCFAARIGALKGENACPGETVTIKLNTEDDDNPSTRILSQRRDRRDVTPGSIPVPGVYISEDKTSITFKYCVFNVLNFNNINYKTKYDYAVLLLDDACPTGSYKVKRHHDTEDGKDNYSWGNVYPNEIGHNADLYYCFVPKKTCPTPYDCSFAPSFPGGGLYENGFFAYAPNYAELSGGASQVYTLFETQIFIDDENSRNENSWDYYGLSSTYRTAFNKFMYNAGERRKDTEMYVAYSYHRPNGGLNKTAAEEVVAKPVNAEQLSAPMVKGLDRSAVAVELKSAGDVRITVANVKGAVVANIVENNLQAGVHQIKWNSGIVPNGRYIVTVKQNGMVNAKNVILK